MNASESRQTLLGYDIDFGSVMRTIYRRAWLVSLCAIAAMLLALVYLHSTTYTYTATLMVSPVTSSGSSASGGLSSKLGGMSGGLGGLASLAGIDLSNIGGNQSFMLYQAGLYSRDVAEQLARQPTIMHTVFAGQWDDASKRWLQPAPWRHALIGVFQDIFGIPHHDWRPPGGADLQDFITNNVDLETDPEKPIVTITFPHQDPEFAVRFLHELDRAVDDKLRDIALVRANQYVDYLSLQIDKVTNADIRQSLMATLTDQENTKMMASATAPFAAQPFGPPSASRRPMHPKPFQVLAIAIALGILLGATAAAMLPSFGRSSVRRRFASKGRDTDQ